MSQTPAQMREEAERLLSQELLNQSQMLVKSLRKDDAPADEPPPEGAGDDAPPAADEDIPPAPSSETPPPAEEDASWTLEEAVEALRAMPPEQLAIWQQAIGQVAADQGGAPGEDMEPPAEEPPMEAMKSELAKMEQRIQKQVQAQVAEALAKSAPAQKPQRRAAVGSAAVATNRSAPLSKAEIDRRLAAKARDAKLSKTDREAINDYTYGRVSAEAVRHLLKD